MKNNFMENVTQTVPFNVLLVVDNIRAIESFWPKEPQHIISVNFG